MRCSMRCRKEWNADELAGASPIQPVGLSLFVSIGEMLYYMRDLCDSLGRVVFPYQENFFFHLISDDSTRKGDCTCRQNRVLSAL